MKSKSMLAREALLPERFQPLLRMVSPFGLTVEDEPKNGQVYGEKIYHVLAFQQHGYTTMLQHIGEVRHGYEHSRFLIELFRPYGNKRYPAGYEFTEFEFIECVWRYADLIQRYGCQPEDLNDVFYYMGKRRLPRFSANRNRALTSVKQAAEVHLMNLPAKLKDTLLERGATLSELRQCVDMQPSYVRALYGLPDE